MDGASASAVKENTAAHAGISPRMQCRGHLAVATIDSTLTRLPLHTLSGYCQRTTAHPVVRAVGSRAVGSPSAAPQVPVTESAKGKLPIHGHERQFDGHARDRRPMATREVSGHGRFAALSALGAGCWRRDPRSRDRSLG